MKRKVYTLPVIDGQTVLVASREVTFDQDVQPDDVGIGAFIVAPDWDHSRLIWHTASGRAFRAHEVTFSPNPYGLLPANAPTMIVWERIE